MAFLEGEGWTFDYYERLCVMIEDEIRIGWDGYRPEESVNTLLPKVIVYYETSWEQEFVTLIRLT